MSLPVIIGSKDVHTLIDASILNGGFREAVDFQHVPEALFQEEHLSIERPSFQILVIILQIGILHHGLVFGYPSIMVGQHPCQCGLAASYVSCYDYVHIWCGVWMMFTV